MAKENVQLQVDSKERVAYDLMLLIDNQIDSKQRSEAEWLAFYQRCLRAVQGLRPAE